ncbi:unnamed protein product [Paramecium pentaurelia]|uniref:EF-hand domain-containing protein n=1 Tax=Paramecium pentaurelia TaxID=43138 RepID=A0A8S1XIK1_9CILI|nr:unnamed protein product [Paramecium pentaurelia]
MSQQKRREQLEKISNSQKEEQDKNRRDELEKEFLKCQKRGQMHTNSMMNWINKHQNKADPKAKEMYRYLPEERRKHIELTLLFEKFDNDGSKALDFIEVFRMFTKYGIFITKKELLDFFKVVDQNKDFSLNLQEFKACYLDSAARDIFAKIMKQLIERTQLTEEEINAALNQMNELNNQNNNNQNQNPIPALPKSFQGVISLLTYLNTRDEIKDKLTSKSVNIYEQINNLKQLIELSNKIDVVQKVEIERKIKIKKSSEDRLNKFKNQLKQIKDRAIQTGQMMAEEELRQKNSAFLITVLPQRKYKYNYKSENKFKKIIPNKQEELHLPRYSDQKVNQFYEYMNINIPDQLKNINNRIWTKLFENNQQLDIILQKNRKNQLESQRTDRLKQKIKQTLDNLQANFETDFDSEANRKPTLESPQEKQSTQFPNFFTSRNLMSQTSEDFRTAKTQRMPPGSSKLSFH